MKHIALILTIILLLGACAQNQTPLTTEEKLAKADELYERGKYDRAAELYGDVYFERQSASSARALLRQADSYFKTNKFAEARLSYQEFSESFPTHPDVSTAVFRYAVCLYEESLGPQYDQTETLQAIDAFRRFIDKYPNSERYADAVGYIQKAQYKLIEKKYLTGYIYYKMKDYSSALMYFKEVTDLGNTDRLDREALYYSALLLYKQDLADQARAEYDRLVAKYPGSKEAKKLAKYFP
ncbi:MAG: outer membrane protein assembly factor BamD [Candidatus Cloacimonetes bacterium]|nr:outer membrane protein assembly factor BamD [Candidatus Cloacimonadota bacterium]